MFQGIHWSLHRHHTSESAPSTVLLYMTLICVYVRMYVHLYSGTSLLRTLWDFNFSLYYRGILNSEVILMHYSIHWDTEWCPYYRGSLNSEVCNREVPLYVCYAYLCVSTYCTCTYIYHAWLVHTCVHVLHVHT